MTIHIDSIEALKSLSAIKPGFPDLGVLCYLVFNGITVSVNKNTKLHLWFRLTGDNYWSPFEIDLEKFLDEIMDWKKEQLSAFERLKQ